MPNFFLVVDFIVVPAFFSSNFKPAPPPPPHPPLKGSVVFSEHWANSDLHCNRCAPSHMGTFNFTGLSITRFWGRNSAPFLMLKSVVFPNSRQKKSQIDRFFFFVGEGGGGGSTSLFHIIQIQNISLHIYNFTELYNTITLASISPFYVSLIIGINLAMETSYIRTMSNFPILVKTRTQYKQTVHGQKYKVMLSWLYFSAISSTTVNKTYSEHTRHYTKLKYYKLQ